jgi:hypothetical protein
VVGVGHSPDRHAGASRDFAPGSPRHASNAQLAISQLNTGTRQFGTSPVTPVENIFLVAVYLTDFPHHELRSQGRQVIRQAG